MLIHSARSAWRALARRPLFAGFVVVVLALGIGANGVVFAIVDGVFIHPLSIDKPDEVMVVQDNLGSSYGWTSLETFRDVIGRSRSFRGASATVGSNLNFEIAGHRIESQVNFVTPNYFSVVGVRPFLGRAFLPADEHLVAAPPAIISWALWRTELGGDTAIVGKPLLLGERSVTVVGVASERFHGTSVAEKVDFWLPLEAARTYGLPQLTRNGELEKDLPAYAVIARLKVGRPQAEAELNKIAGPQAGGAQRESSVVSLRPPGRFVLVDANAASLAVRDKGTATGFIVAIAAVIAACLALACFNVAALLAIRAAERAKEVAIRRALGANGRQIVATLASEGAILVVLATALGILIAAAGLRSARGLTVPGGLSLQNVSFAAGWKIALFTGLLGAVVVAAVGFVAAVQGTAVAIADALKGDSVHPILKGERLLVASQIGLSLMLTFGAASFVRTLAIGRKADIGFDASRLVAVSVLPKWDGKHVDNLPPYFSALSQIERLSGVKAAAVTTHVPIAGKSMVPFAGVDATGARRQILMPIAAITPGFFQVLRVRMIAGRSFSSSDTRDAERVVIINQAAARALLGTDYPVGMTITAYRSRAYKIVGVVQDTKYLTLQDDHVPFAYGTIEQEDFTTAVSFIARSTEPKRTLIEMDRIVSETAKDLRRPETPMLRPRFVSEQVLTKLAPQRFGAAVLGFSTVLALIIAGSGVYGSVSYGMIKRSRELGIRLALGASSRSLVVEVAHGTLKAVAFGGGFALICAIVAARFLVRILPADSLHWSVFAWGVGVLAICAGFAALIPAVRATLVDPSATLRNG